MLTKSTSLGSIPDILRDIGTDTSRDKQGATFSVDNKLYCVTAANPESRVEVHLIGEASLGKPWCEDEEFDPDEMHRFVCQLFDKEKISNWKYFGRFLFAPTNQPPDRKPLYRTILNQPVCDIEDVRDKSREEMITRFLKNSKSKKDTAGQVKTKFINIFRATGNFDAMVKFGRKYNFPL